MPTNNPTGINSYDPPGPEIPYGEMQVRNAEQSLAPLAGQDAIASLTNAPRRAQRHAVQGASADAVRSPAPPTLLVPATPSPAAQVAEFWKQAAAEPGASALVQSIAQQAVESAAGGAP